jgi:hypothetical protein
LNAIPGFQSFDQMAEFNEWDSFYVIVGGAAGALIGLQFVVLTLIAARPQRTELTAGSAFSTPTVLYFCTVLLIAAVIRAPWQTDNIPRIIGLLIAFLGIGYSALTVLRIKKQHTYEPEFVDWLTYAILPTIAYLLLLLSVLLPIRSALFATGAADLLLLFIGIYNAWDTVTYHVFTSTK